MCTEYIHVCNYNNMYMSTHYVCLMPMFLCVQVSNSMEAVTICESSSSAQVRCLLRNPMPGNSNVSYHLVLHTIECMNYCVCRSE